jgi:hypothetical protein
MLEFRTQGFNGYAVKYSPFYDNRIAVASAANFGLVGNGRLYILELTANGIQPLKQSVPNRRNDLQSLTTTTTTPQILNSRLALRPVLVGSPRVTMRNGIG